MTDAVSLIGGMVLTPDGGLDVADVHIADGLIVDSAPQNATRIDCRGCHVLPGIVDVHGDAFEVELHPRPGVEMDFRIAMGSVDKQLVMNGITTAFHGLSVSWEPGARGLPAARRFMAGIRALRPRLIANHHVQLRWETFAHDTIDDLAGWLSHEPTPSIAFNDHATETLDTLRAGGQATLDRWARRAGVSLSDYVAAAELAEARAPEVLAKIEEVAALAQSNGAIMLAHDESTLSDREAHRALGMQVSEFPLSPEVAADAVAKGEHVVMGAPNTLRGRSHKGHLSAEDAVRDGLCTVLASDYYYPSLFHAAERLTQRGVLPLSDAWTLIAGNPAAAMGLTDRGQIATGHRADIVVADCSDGWRLIHTITGGRVARFPG